ncbi:hypothetical protein [Streptomyces sp. TLI_171]|uniref:hypothetical protein n=1 Tax=Streptomyces sp. TLI_171 TaxID=1938859 RepID=UPI000C17F5D5|nr:hypothetical protein [Streptomyces sp. TLI_171]RKE21947.1 hypothetical protein BX266_5355 [Streptomyces sp. TLI_171]
MTASTFRPVYHPAGFDVELQGAVDDLVRGRWMSTERLLSGTARASGLWTSRTQVLAVAAARSTVLTAWAREHPAAPGLNLLQARVLVEHALLAAEDRRPEARQLEQAAREACWAAAEADPLDPVPWVCLLTLASLDHGQDRPEHRVFSGDPLLPPGPWGLLGEALRRDPDSREAHHRMLRYWQQRNRAAAVDFVHTAAARASAGSPLAALHLYVSVDQYRFTHYRDALVRRQWLREPHVSNTRRAYESWLAAKPGSWPVADLSYLAHALWAGVRMSAATEVFTALGQFASKTPWAHVADSPEKGEELMRTARQQALAGRATALA